MVANIASDSYIDDMNSTTGAETIIYEEPIVIYNGMGGLCLGEKENVSPRI